MEGLSGRRTKGKWEVTPASETLVILTKVEGPSTYCDLIVSSVYPNVVTTKQSPKQIP